ncbi:hypothetical protein PHLGIDRAFT_227246 [Phlebiopsis gigantea 11061_1 CR5-6]|uniref:Pali-domain-containing protein n=1 Tax=Phlebiopsis gigantea (strain 11061_1 CR5-6) TaxID=745531 RepID=A0A0C3NG54_PHLG1|nr:hypothetical protein PHLGIDRAFT_227246 [Phlebiopsis gigantea 11061_1 CR5-6]
MPPIIIEQDDGGYGHHHRHQSSYSRHHRHHHRSRWRACFPCFAYRRPHIHSTQRFRGASIAAFLLLLAAFVLYLLAALSLPIIKPIYLLQINFATPADQPPTSVATNLRFGVWGFCASSVLDLPTVLTNDGRCTAPRLGYDVPADVLTLLGFPQQVAQALLEGLTVLLVLHPVAAGVALAALPPALFLRHTFATVLALVVAVIGALVGSVVLAADIALVVVADHKLRQALGDLLSVSFGDAVWMIVAAVACSWLSVIFLSAIACRCCGIRRKHGWYGDGYYG